MICCPPLVAVQLLQRATHAPMSHCGSSSSVVKDMSESSCRVFAQVMCAVTLRLSVTEMSNCVVTGALPHHFAVGGAPSRTSHVNTSHVTRHTSHVTRHASRVTRHTSHVTRHTSQSNRTVVVQGQGSCAPKTSKCDLSFIHVSCQCKQHRLCSPNHLLSSCEECVLLACCDVLSRTSAPRTLIAK